MAAATSIIQRIGMHLVASTAHPTLPASGSNISVADWTSAGFSTLGGTNSRGDDFDFDEDEVNFFNVTERFADVTAPLSDGIDKRVLISRKLEPIEFLLYDINTSLFNFDSAGDVTSNVFTFGDPTTPTNRTVAIEICGEGLWYFPSCYVSVQSVNASYVDDGAARTMLTIQPVNTTALPNGGFSYEKY